MSEVHDQSKQGTRQSDPCTQSRRKEKKPQFYGCSTASGQLVQEAEAKMNSK